MKSAFAGACSHTQKTIVLALTLIASPASARQDLTPAQQNAYNAVAFAPIEAEKQIDAAKVLQTMGDMDGACKTWMAARNALNITIEQQQIASQNGFTISDYAETKAQQATALEKFNIIVLPGMQASCFVPGILAYQKQLSGPNRHNVNQIIVAGAAVPGVGGHAQGGYASSTEVLAVAQTIPGLKAIFYTSTPNQPSKYVIQFAKAYDVDAAIVAAIRKTGTLNTPQMKVAQPSYATAHLNDDGYEIVANVMTPPNLRLQWIIGEDGTSLLGNGLRVEHPSASSGYLRKLFKIEASVQRWKEAKLVYERFVQGSVAAYTSEPVAKTRIEMLGELAKSRQPETITFIKAEIKKHKIPAKDAAVILAAK
jgi:hypothetical protein